MKVMSLFRNRKFYSHWLTRSIVQVTKHTTVNIPHEKIYASPFKIIGREISLNRQISHIFSLHTYHHHCELIAHFSLFFLYLECYCVVITRGLYIRRHYIEGNDTHTIFHCFYFSIHSHSFAYESLYVSFHWCSITFYD